MRCTFRTKLFFHCVFFIKNLNNKAVLFKRIFLFLESLVLTKTERLNKLHKAMSFFKQFYST